jgi:hypothetical protein
MDSRSLVGAWSSQYTTRMTIDLRRWTFLGRAQPEIAAFALAVICGCGTADLAAATIALHQDAVTATVARRLFTNNGKRMLSGSLASCTYVYLEQPAVALRDGRLFLRVHLAGRAGLNMNGSCVGAGDAFYTTVSGQPYVDGETIGLKGFRVDEGKAEYRGLLEPLLQQQIPSLLGLNLRDELTRLFQNNSSEFKVTLLQFQLIDVAARDGLLTVHFDFALRANKP